jgi:hypothetical protein
MAITAALKAFLDLTDGEIAAYVDARAADLDLRPPEPTLAGVRDNLGLLRAQTALFVAALGVGMGDERAGELAETFQP